MLDLNPQLRYDLAMNVIAVLSSAVPGSEAELRGSLAEGSADIYSDIDIRWQLPDASFVDGVTRLNEYLSSIGEVESVRIDPDLQRSEKHRLIYVQMEDVPLFWRVDIEAFAESINKDPSYDLDNELARGVEWSVTRSALMNAVGAIKGLLRNASKDDIQAGLDRAFIRIGHPVSRHGLRSQILELVSLVEEMDPEQTTIARRIRALYAGAFSPGCVEEGRNRQ